MSHCCAPQCQTQSQATVKRSDGLFAGLFKLMLLWAVTVFAAGTLVQIEHPVANETGRLLRLVTMIEPAIHVAGQQGWTSLENSLRVLADGAPVNWIVSTLR